VRKEVISPFQLAMLIANTLLAASLITLPQILAQAANQNAWLTVFLIAPIILGMLLIGIGRKVVKETLNNEDSFLTKSFHYLLLIYLSLLYIRDLRAFVDFIGANLLPTTPIEVITILLSLTLLYITLAGLEVLARINLIQFTIFAFIVLSAPFLLLNEINMANFLPIFGPGVVSNLSTSSYFMLPWMGEVVIFFLLFSNISTTKHLKRATLLGTGLGLFLIGLLIALDVAVLGSDIVARSTYPNFIMIQEINITDFLDRLDLVIVTVWMPCLISKIALTSYCIFQTLLKLKVAKSSFIFPPVGLFLGVLSIILFTSNVDHLEFSFYTWTFIGLVLEFLIIGLYVWLRFRYKKELMKVT
jgi:spore germination protein